METKEVDLGGGWFATIKRPSNYVAACWGEATRPAANGNTVPGEKGRDEPEVVTVKLTPEYHRFCEEQLIPESVLGYRNPEGKALARADVYPPDLGLSRVGRLTSAIAQFVNEADASFRDEVEAAATG